MHNSWFQLWWSFWWLIFPLGWLLGRAARLWSRHVRAQKSLDLIKSYVDQGKEPPPELLQVLRNFGDEPFRGRSDWEHRDWGSYIWIPVFLFAALAAAFVMMAVWPGREKGLIFVAIIMVGLCLGNLVALLTRKKPDQNRTLPK